MCNMHPLCRHHHRLKTFGRWQVRFTRAEEPYPAGTVEWISRKGARHISLPQVLPGSNGWVPPPPKPPVFIPPPRAWLVSTVEGPDDVVIPPDVDPDADQDGRPAHEPTRAQRRAQRVNRWRHELNRFERPDNYRRHPGLIWDLDDPNDNGPGTPPRQRPRPNPRSAPPPIDVGEPPF